MAEYRKMNGEWGIVGADGEIVPGARVRVVRRDGRVSFETVGRVLWRAGGRAGAEKVPEGKAAAPQAPAAAQVTEAPAAPQQRSEGFCPSCDRRLSLALPVTVAKECLCGKLIGHAADVNEGPAPDYTPAVQAPAFTPQAPAAPANVMIGVSMNTIDRENATDEVRVVTYYIPDGADVENPARLFRQRGFSVDKGGSVYVIPESRMPWHWVDRALKCPGATVTAFKLHPTEVAPMRELCRTTLEGRIAQQRDALTAGMAKYELELQAAPAATDEEREAARKRYLANARGALRRMEELLSDLTEAASGFGQDLCGLTAEARDRVVALRQDVAVRAVLYVELAQQVQGTELAAAAQTADVPAGVLADFLEDQGADVGAVRDVFVN